MNEWNIQIACLCIEWQHLSCFQGTIYAVMLSKCYRIGDSIKWLFINFNKQLWTIFSPTKTGHDKFTGLVIAIEVDQKCSGVCTQGKQGKANFGVHTNKSIKRFQVIFGTMVRIQWFVFVFVCLPVLCVFAFISGMMNERRPYSQLSLIKTNESGKMMAIWAAFVPIFRSWTVSHCPFFRLCNNWLDNGTSPLSSSTKLLFDRSKCLLNYRWVCARAWLTFGHIEKGTTN